jgi:hypothetical protein
MWFEVPEGTGPADIVVAALKGLGGIGYLGEIVEQCRAIGHPQPSVPSIGYAKSSDPEVRRQTADRRVKAHFELVKAFEARAKAAGLECKCDQYADVLCEGNIFEMKTLANDEIAQVRAAVGQLYHYTFIHRNLRGYASPNLYAAFDRDIDDDLMHFLVWTARIGVITKNQEPFEGATTAHGQPYPSFSIDAACR